MNTGQELVLDLAEQLNTIKLPLMALKLDELYRSPGYPAMDKLDCVDSTIRRYEPHGMPMILSSLQFIEDGLNVCILGASDSGKTYLAKALGSIACVKYRVSYNRCNELLESLVALKTEDYTKYKKQIRRLLNFHLLILDDFLMNTIMDEREVKILVEIMEKRIELSRSTIVCSQREPDSWKAMIMNDEVSANAILKRATKHYTIMIQLLENKA